MRLDPGSWTLTAQDFRHISQEGGEKVADFIHRLERTFTVAYGKEGMSIETCETLLHGQLQDGLKQELMQAAAVSGAQGYKELYLAARNEEKRLAELVKRQEYLKPADVCRHDASLQARNAEKKSSVSSQTRGGKKDVKCFVCQKFGHYTNECKLKSAGNQDAEIPRERLRVQSK